jgi:molybdopterin-guanine dinucleotide biosynthesis protein A
MGRRVNASTIAGLFVGGRATRMGGHPKGLMHAPSGPTIVDRWRALLDSLSVPAVLVGAHPAYAHLGIPMVADDPVGIGPLGGLVALLRRAGSGRALALAGDMPFVSRALVARLLSGGDAPVLAFRRGERWEPLCARYDAPRVLPIAVARAASGLHSLQGLLDEAGAVGVPLSEAEQDELSDWDSPGDLADRTPTSTGE